MTIMNVTAVAPKAVSICSSLTLAAVWAVRGQERTRWHQGVFQEWVNRDPREETSWQDVSDILDPEFEYREDPAWPGAATYRGIPAFRRVMIGYYDAFGEMRVEAKEFLDAGDRVVVFMSWWARGQSGADAVWPQAGIFTVRGEIEVEDRLVHRSSVSDSGS